LGAPRVPGRCVRPSSPSNSNNVFTYTVVIAEQPQPSVPAKIRPRTVLDGKTSEPRSTVTRVTVLCKTVLINGTVTIPRSVTSNGKVSTPQSQNRYGQLKARWIHTLFDHMHPSPPRHFRRCLSDTHIIHVLHVGRRKSPPTTAITKSRPPSVSATEPMRRVPPQSRRDRHVRM